MQPDEIYHLFPDHERFCSESLSVQDKFGKLVPLRLGPAQRKLNLLVQKLRSQAKPIRIVYLKARQVWGTVGVAAQFFHGTAFRPGQHTLVVAQDELSVRNIFAHYRRFQEHYHPFADVIKLPRLVRQNEGELEWENGSWIKVKTARNLSLGRSFTIRRLHLSEFAFYQDARTLMTSLMQAVPNDPDTMVVVESTANGLGNEFHQLWQRANDPQCGSDWTPMFFGCFDHPEYRLPLSMPADRFQHSLDAEERELMRLYSLGLEQLNWRRWAIENNCGGDKAKFRQEYPACPEEAFQASGRPRFSIQHIERMPAVRDAVSGGLEQVHYGVERRLMFQPRERGELTLYRRPVETRHYVIGADVAEGIDASGGRGEDDSDFSVAQVLDRDTGEQVAILRARMAPAEFGAYLAALGRFYNSAGIVPEANGPGISTIDELLRQQYPAHLIYHRNDSPDSDPHRRVSMVGWKTTMVTRPQLISILDRAIREMSIILHDPLTLQELRTFVIHANGRASAQQGCHDDSVIALALAVVGIEQLPLPKVQLPRRDMEIKKYGGSAESNERRGTLLRIRPPGSPRMPL